MNNLPELPLTSGKNNNALIELIMEEYFFLYHYYCQQLIEQVDDNKLISWARQYKQLIEKSKQKDDKLYDGDLYKRAYTENLTTGDGYVTALIPTIKKRYSYIKGLSLDQKFGNKIISVDQAQDTIFISLTPAVTDEAVVIEYMNRDKELKKIRATRKRGRKKFFYGILPQEAISFYVYVVVKGIKYSFPYNGILEPLEAGSSKE